ncbi:glycosyltransferase family 87 protein [Streptomyces sp. NPDC050564]|uniref:glycosyltransferase family 87 protein n=1 Tax=Streptomyces sp. NPDC050564 TaxID=3365631 RepID=UPI0037BA69BF
MNEGKSDISGWLVRRASWHAWAVLALVLCVPVVNVVRRSSDGGMDNAIVVRAARTWLDGGSPYADPHFLYLPGAVLAAVPQALLPLAVLRVLVPLAVTGLLAAGWGCALRIHGIAWRSRFAVLGLTGLALGFAPFGHLVTLGNWTVTAAVALPLGLLCAVRGRWVAAGVVIGAAIVLKPLLAPVALLFVFAREWRGLGSLVLVPAVVSGGAALLMPDPAGFVTRTLPFLLRGHDRFVRLYEASPGPVLARLGVPQGVATSIAFMAAGAGVWCAYRRWCRADPGPLRLVETAVTLMLSAFLVSRPSYDHYLLVVVPLLVAGVPLPGSVARSPWFWLALVPQVPGFSWPWLEPVTRRAFRDCLTLCVLAAAVAVRPELSLGRVGSRPALQAVPARPALRDDCPQR